jgi:hypothetical protein
MENTMESRILKSLSGKKVMISFKNNTLGNLVIGTMEDADNVVIILSTDPNKKKDKYDLQTKKIMNYIPVIDIESITDVSDPEIYETVINTIKAQQESIKAKSERAEKQQDAAREALQQGG